MINQLLISDEKHQVHYKFLTNISVHKTKNKIKVIKKRIIKAKKIINLTLLNKSNYKTVKMAKNYRLQKIFWIINQHKHLHCDILNHKLIF